MEGRSFVKAFGALVLGIVALARADAVPVEVTTTRTVSQPIASGFAGFSYEKNTLYSPLFSGSNAGLIALFQRLGPGLLRVGGNSVDQTHWNSTGAGLVKGVVSPPDLQRLAAFLRAADWKVLYGVNMGTSTPDSAAMEAAAADSILGDRLEAFEIGNEPDLYHSNGLRPATWTYGNFRAEWDSFAVAVKASAAGVPLTGPAAADQISWVDSFAHEEPKSTSLLTMHYYLANGEDSTSTVAKLLAPAPSRTNTLLLLDGYAQYAGLPYRMAETNSYYNGGAPNVSDAYGSALWVLDYLFTLARCGASGANFHGGGSGPGYTPIANSSSTGSVVQVRPEYYGISLFTLAAKGNLRGTTVSDSTALSAWSVDDSDGTTRIVLLNVDTLDTVLASVHPGTGFVQATALALRGTSIDSVRGVTLGGDTIGVDGSWSGASGTSLALAGDSLSVAVPPASALLITLSKTSTGIRRIARRPVSSTLNGSWNALGRRGGNGNGLSISPAGMPILHSSSP
jgi:hypothetical protein